MKFALIKSYAKINLSLGVIKKLKSNYHKIESLVSFIDLYDEIKIVKIMNKNHKIFFSGKFSNGIKSKNTISQLFKILDDNNLINNRKYLIKIKKNIPQKSGLAGGSMNASAIIAFFVNKKILNLTETSIIKLCKQIGHDVQLGLDYKKKILFSNGQLVSLSKKTKFFVIIVRPNFGCSTQKIYKGLKKYSKKKITKLNKNYFSLQNVTNLKNDLEKVAFKDYPKLKNLKLFMQKLPNIRFARMTGSGSCIVGYFLLKNDAVNAAKLLKKKYKNYWCIISKTI